MRIVICLVVYFVIVHLGTDILDFLGFGIGEGYGMSFTGEQNFSMAGAFVSTVVALIAATALIVLDDGGIAFFIAVAYWLWQIYGDYGDIKKIAGFLGFIIFTLENIIMIGALIIMNSVRGKIKDILRKNRDNSKLPPINDE